MRSGEYTPIDRGHGIVDHGRFVHRGEGTRVHIFDINGSAHLLDPETGVELKELTEKFEWEYKDKD